MAKPKQIEAAVVESLKGTIHEDRQFALIKAIRPGGSPSGADDIDLAIPVQMLPKVLGLVLHLIESSDAKLPSSRAGKARRRCFDAANVGLGETGDGRRALTFDLAVGGKIAIAINDEEARRISEFLAQPRRGERAPATSEALN